MPQTCSESRKHWFLRNTPVAAQNKDHSWKHGTATLRTFLQDYDLEYVSTHNRPRGVAMKFCRGPHHVYATWEGNVFSIDLVVQVSGGSYVRISLNQAFWYHGVKALASRTSCDAQLKAFMEKAGEVCGPLLAGVPAEFDDRYCFPMSQEEFQDYCRFQED